MHTSAYSPRVPYHINNYSHLLNITLAYIVTAMNDPSVVLRPEDVPIIPTIEPDNPSCKRKRFLSCRPSPDQSAQSLVSPPTVSSIVRNIWISTEPFYKAHTSPYVYTCIRVLAEDELFLVAKQIVLQMDACHVRESSESNRYWIVSTRLRQTHCVESGPSDLCSRDCVHEPVLHGRHLLIMITIARASGFPIIFTTYDSKFATLRQNVR